MTNITNGMTTMPPEKDEIETSMRRLKDGKAYNDIPAALLKYAADSKELVKEVTKLFKKVWEYKKVPTIWGHFRISCTLERLFKG